MSSSSQHLSFKSWSAEENIQEVLKDRWVLWISHNTETLNVLSALKRTCKDTQKFLLMFWSVRNTSSSKNIFVYILELPLFWFLFQKDGCCSTNAWNSMWNIQHSWYAIWWRGFVSDQIMPMIYNGCTSGMFHVSRK